MGRKAKYYAGMKSREYWHQRMLDRDKKSKLSEDKIIADGRCTLCYRCVNQCSEKAITILGKQVIFQHSVYDFH